MYLAPAIDEVLEGKKSKLSGHLTYYQIAGTLTRCYKKAEIPFKFRFETYDDYGPTDISVSGLYDTEEDVKYIILNFSKETKHFTISDKNWREFKFAVSQVCQHETIHQLQWQNRESDGQPCTIDFRNLRGSTSEDKEYLSDVDEIDAYGHDIAMEIKYSYPNKNPYEILKTIDSRRKVWSYTYYKKTFKGDDWSKIKNRLLKKTFQWLPHVTL